MRIETEPNRENPELFQPYTLHVILSLYILFKSSIQ